MRADRSLAVFGGWCSPPRSRLVFINNRQPSTSAKAQVNVMAAMVHDVDLAASKRNETDGSRTKRPEAALRFFLARPVAAMPLHVGGNPNGAASPHRLRRVPCPARLSVHPWHVRERDVPTSPTSRRTPPASSWSSSQSCRAAPPWTARFLEQCDFSMLQRGATARKGQKCILVRTGRIEWKK